MNRRRDDPYFDRKTYHMAKHFSDNGDVSALCYSKPRKIKLDRGQSWTIVTKQVTCSKCKAAMRAAGAPTPEVV